MKCGRIAFLQFILLINSFFYFPLSIFCYSTQLSENVWIPSLRVHLSWWENYFFWEMFWFWIKHGRSYSCVYLGLLEKNTLFFCSLFCLPQFSAWIWINPFIRPMLYKLFFIKTKTKKALTPFLFNVGYRCPQVYFDIDVFGFNPWKIGCDTSVKHDMHSLYVSAVLLSHTFLHFFSLFLFLDSGEGNSFIVSVQERPSAALKPLQMEKEAACFVLDHACHVESLALGYTSGQTT